MNSTQSFMDVALIVRDFLQNEARTLEISQGKMLRDEEYERAATKYLRVS